MKKIMAIICCLAFAVCGFACGPGEGNGENGTEMIVDRQFRYGLTSQPSAEGYPGAYPISKNHKTVLEGVQPIWTVAQWGDNFLIADGTAEEIEEGVFRFCAPGKAENGGFDKTLISKYVELDTNTGAFALELNTSMEYEEPRKQGDRWCHLLLSNGFLDNAAFGELTSFEITLDMTLEKFEDHMGGAANPNLHAAQFILSFVIKSSNGKDSMYVNIPLFDNRYPTSGEKGSIDAGSNTNTGNFIYKAATADFLDREEEIVIGEKRKVRADLCALVRRAVALAQENDKFTDTSYEDVTLGAFTIGYEIPGIYDMRFRVENFHMKADATRPLRTLDEE